MSHKLISLLCTFALLLTSCSIISDLSVRERRTGKVISVTDGDTLEIQFTTKTEKVRLLLIDTPEVHHPTKSVQPFGPDASTFTKNKLLGKTVQVEQDVEPRDKYGRQLAYVYLNGKSVQEMLLAEGLARVVVYAPNDRDVDRFRDVEQKAQQEGKGIWSIHGYVTDRGFNDIKQTKQPAQQQPTPKHNPQGSDRDCGDFANRREAQAFFQAAGSHDPHRLDLDHDGQVCENTPYPK